MHIYYSLQLPYVVCVVTRLSHSSQCQLTCFIDIVSINISLLIFKVKATQLHTTGMQQLPTTCVGYILVISIHTEYPCTRTITRISYSCYHFPIFLWSTKNLNIFICIPYRIKWHSRYCGVPITLQLGWLTFCSINNTINFIFYSANHN